MNKKEIINEFIRKEIGEFELDAVYRGVDLHKKFNYYIKNNPVNQKQKYCLLFGSKTKTVLKAYLEQDLGLKYFSRKTGYYISYEPGYCDNLNKKLYEGIE